jgi:hypothetical protein
MTNKSHDQLLTELSVRQEQTAVILERISETIEGTARTQGMKEKITLAQFNIEANKLAYQNTEASIHSLEERLNQTIAGAISNLNKKIDDKFNELKQDNESQNTFITKVKPWVGFLSWFITGAGAILLSMFLTGRLHIGIVP